ncbi:hypothetical protein DDZ18_09055 [Marinicauda salina]|uniref:Uncharacterized protein n=1 Tax=Marinicauda salina TaxID=2135793 RepID=A0A2U2BUT5_9PROT|nr:efflux RND transporter periplasmic adaptor subunit [Marinicauda salina]PWE17791.1 hypothetical protein DDZ18_09055 [Marinicauda salina]
MPSFPPPHAILLLLWLLSAAGAAAQSTIPVSPAARAALGVEIETTEAGERFAGAEASATVIAPPGRLQSAASPFAGVLVEPLVMPGAPVEAGDPLAVIYSPDFADARAELETRRLTAEHAGHLAERAARLRAEGLMADQDVQEARHDARAAELALGAMQARLDTVRPDDGPGRYRIVAPAAGVVAHVHVQSGGAVDAAGPVASIFTGERFWARAQAPARAADILLPGASARIGGWAEPGEIVSIDPEIDAMSRSLEVMVRLPEGGPWRLGLLIDLVFDAEAPEGSVAAPAAAVIRIGDNDTVFVERGDGFAPTPVTVMARSRDTVLLDGALSPGDRVAVSGLAALKNMVETG